MDIDRNVVKYLTGDIFSAFESFDISSDKESKCRREVIKETISGKKVSAQKLLGRGKIH